VLWRLQFSLWFFVCPTLTPVADKAADLGLELDLGKTFSGIPGHDLVRALRDRFQTGSLPVEGQADRIKDGGLP